MKKIYRGNVILIAVTIMILITCIIFVCNPLIFSNSIKAKENPLTEPTKKHENPLTEPTEKHSETPVKKEIPKDPNDIHIIVNKKSMLPDGYRPNDLVVPDVTFAFSGICEKSYMRKEAARALEKLFALAEKDGITLQAVSGFRSLEYQKSVYQNNVRKQGKEETDRVSARPGHSEHQTGLTMDVSASSVDNTLEQSFGTTKEGKWLAENAYRAGFIIRYLKGKENITGYSYEPWHIRYVGDIAKEIYEKGITLEEYYNEN
ncbi:D-alanyl-D-alanine carboxypeptidase family protein [Bacillus cereus group sp. BfR-BA-01380]|uniref:M15 family metallopeptidase n=1 Tax=Bacillus cereus group sp. BfR-BA-01380 TaxID=2920324 RepID=UPI001F5A94AD|nr:M15 family metallopeptidase [Bacillus cereus group sp. BfR-BA-01380]